MPGGTLADFWFNMEEGGLRSHVGPFTLEAGRFLHYDVIDSPYSLFENSNGNSTLLMTLRYDSDFFYFQTRWLSLDQDVRMTTPTWSDTAITGQLGSGHQATNGFPNRGANVRVYGLHLSPTNGLRLRGCCALYGQKLRR